jgi:phosphoglycerate kinase
VTGIPIVMKQGSAGYLMDKEIKAFLQILQDPPRPLCAIVGGAKVSDKILLLENLLGKINKLLIGGAMAYTFLKAQGHTTGTSLVEEDQLDLAKKLIEQAKEKGVEVCLPIDHICHTAFGQTDTPLITEGVDIPDGYMALDIGPKTLEIYLAQIKESKACLWNGPMGVFEIDTYSKGTFSVAKTMAELTQGPEGLLSIIGGGDSAAAAEQSGQADKMSHVSTGGGASLELLEGKVLPGLNVLDNA